MGDLFVNVTLGQNLGCRVFVSNFRDYIGTTTTMYVLCMKSATIFMHRAVTILICI